jgi:hypothetical protein
MNPVEQAERRERRAARHDRGADHDQQRADEAVLQLGRPRIFHADHSAPATRMKNAG